MKLIATVLAALATVAVAVAFADDASAPVFVKKIPPAIATGAPRSWVERTFPHLVYFHEVDRGGHFAAWEQPELMASEVRAAFRSLR